MKNKFFGSFDSDKNTAESDLRADELQERVKRQAEAISRLRSLLAEDSARVGDSPSAKSVESEDSETAQIETLERRVRDRGFELQRLRTLVETLSFDSGEDGVLPSPTEKEKPIPEQTENFSDPGGMADGSLSAVFHVAERLTFGEAYRLLMPKQKRYCDELVKYAVKKSGTSEKYAKYYLLVGVGAKQLLKLGIKDGIVVAYFRVEDQRLRELRRKSGDATIKIKETLLQVDNDDAFSAAKEIIDLRETQIMEDVAAKKESRNRKRRKSDL